MGEAIPKDVKDLWDKWNIRGLVILSLALQTILVLLSPNRKRTHLRSFRFLMWSAYLLANWAAEYAVGQISESQGDQPQPKNNDLLAFWSTFLLLHLGGPDTITALALEDNNLWLRNLFGLVCQGIATLYIFLLSIPNNLVVPTSLMLVAGIIKYVERIKALRGASLETFKNSMLGEPDPGPDYARLMEEYSTREMLREPTRIVRIEEVEKGLKPKAFVRPHTSELTDLEVVQYAYKYFNVFKGLVVDLIFSNKSEQWDNSKEFFISLNPLDALKVLEVELSFMYGTFFTKVDILHTKIGVVFRFLALASLGASLWIFITAKKHDYNSFDVGLTYALLLGGIALDLVAIFIFCVSDWTFARWRKPKENVNDKDNVDKALDWLLRFRKLEWKKYNCFDKKGVTHFHSVLNRKFIFRRWSEYIYSYNLIGYSLGIKPGRIHKTKGSIHSFFDDIIGCLYIDCAIKCIIRTIGSWFRAMTQKAGKARRWMNHFIDSSSTTNRRLYHALYPMKLFLKLWFGIPLINYILDFFSISDLLNGMIYTSRDRLTKEMWEFLYEEVASRNDDIVKRLGSASEIYSARGEWKLGKTLAGKSRNGPDRIKLLRSVTQVDYDQSILIWHIATELLYQTEEGSVENHSKRVFSKILSDYMMYLLIVQPNLMSTVAGIDKIRFMEAIAEAKNFPEVKKFVEKNHLENLKDAKEVCKAVLKFFEDLKEREGKRYQRRNVLEDGSRLAIAVKQLSKKGDVNWEVISEVWVEMLCYAATHCDPKQHVAQLSKGGEFLSFVWLLMAHFGLGEQFQSTDGKATAKVIVTK